MRGEIGEILQKLRWQATITPLEDVAAMCKSAARAIEQGEIDRELLERWVHQAALVSPPNHRFAREDPEGWAIASATYQLNLSVDERRWRAESLGEFPIPHEPK